MMKYMKNALVVLGAAILASGLLAACSADTEETDAQVSGLQTQVQQLEQQLDQLGQRLDQSVEDQAAQSETGKASLRIIPDILRYPKGRGEEGGVWFYAAGLEPHQWITISVYDPGLEAELGLQLLSPGIEMQANAAGGYMGTLGELRPGRYDMTSPQVETDGGVLEVRLRDGDTGALLATAPWVICGSEGESYWCRAAEALLPEVPEAPEDLVRRVMAEVALEAAGGYLGIVYNVDRFQVEDNLFQVRMGFEPFWGYGVEERINATEGDGIVMTINLGDTIKFDALRTSGSRTTKQHHFAIAGLGIDVETGPGVRIEPYELKPEITGEFVIDDPSDPGKHGKALLIVNEPPDGSG